jgi:hypothetical protein
MSGSSRRNLAGAAPAMVARMALCGGARFGVGALVGLAAPPGLTELFAGPAVGFARVHERSRDI